MSNPIFRRSGILLAALPAFFISAGAVAQDAAPNDSAARAIAEPLAETDAAATRGIVQSQGLIERSGFASSAPQFQLSTTSDKTEVSIGLTAELARSRSTLVGDEDRRVATTTRFSFQGSAPINENGEDTFVNLASPLSGSRLKFGITRYVTRYTITGERIALARRSLNQAFSSCLTRRVNAWAAGRSDEDRQLAARYLDAFAERMRTPAGQSYPQRAENVIGALRTEFSGLPADLREGCLIGQTEGGPENNERLIETYGDPARAGSVLSLVTGDAPTYFYGVEGTVSQKNHSFLDRTAFAIDDVDHTGYQGSAFAGVIGGTGTWSLRAGISHARSYRDARRVELCQPVGGAGQLQCLSGPDGRPVRRQSTVLTLEGRQLFRIGGGLVSNIGIAPEFAYDFESDEFSIDVPIYLAANREGALTGGVRVGYSSQDGEVAFGVFVGVPFTIFR